VKKEKGFSFLRNTVLLIALIIAVTPIILVVSNSIKPTLLIRTPVPTVIFKPTLSHFEKVFQDGNIGTYFMNSVIVATVTTIVSVVGGAFGGYGLTISRAKWSQRASNFILLGKLVPAIAILIPLFSIIFMVRLNDTYVGVILAHCSVNLPFVLWLMLGFMKDIPTELFESAKIDGATRMQTFWKIVFPILRPATGSAILLSMQYSWNELIFALQLTNMKSYTLPVGISRFVGSVSVDWGKSSAAAVVTMVPVIIVGFMMQKYLVSGLTAGAVKG
jgi:ABC-type sugar transport system, permease component